MANLDKDTFLTLLEDVHKELLMFEGDSTYTWSANKHYPHTRMDFRRLMFLIKLRNRPNKTMTSTETVDALVVPRHNLYQVVWELCPLITENREKSESGRCKRITYTLSDEGERYLDTLFNVFQTKIIAAI